MARILIVDDEKHFVQQLTRMVTGFGHQVISTVYSSFVPQILEEEEVDLILMDIYMPEIDGITLLKQLKVSPEFQTIPIIILTSDTDEHLLKSCFHEGASDFITKPVKEAVLQARMSAILNTQKYIATLENEITEKERLEKQIRHSQKMEALGTLAGGVAHEFNNLLFGMLGYAKLAYDDLEDESPSKNDLKEVLETGQKAKELIQQVLTFSRQTERTRHPVRLERQMKEAVDIIRSRMPDNIEIITNFHAEQVYILGDEAQTLQMLLNILSNSLTALRKQGGIIQVHVENLHLSANESPAIGLQGTDCFKITIQDNGPGIPVDNLERIFDPFFTTQGLAEASGLGLSIVHGIVHSLGGSIEVENLEPSGCQSIIYLPVHTEKEGQIEDSAPTQKEHVLLVDDEEIVLVILKKMLKKYGYEVTTVQRSKKALEYFKSHPDLYDLVITDQLMPEMDGTDLSKKMLEIRPDIPIILMTGYSKSVALDVLEKVGIKAFLIKPIVDDDLVKAIDSSLK